MEIVQKASVFHNASVIATVNGEITRKVREAIEIRNRKSLINKSKGPICSDEVLHLYADVLS